MNVTILRNDAFTMLCEVTGMNPERLEQSVLTNMIEERIMFDEPEDPPTSLQNIGLSSGYQLTELLNVIFPGGEYTDNREVRELMPSIIVI